MRLPVDGLDGGEQSGDLRAAAKEMPDRPGDFRGRKRSGRRLIEQRLKQVMVATIDDRDANRRSSETVNRLEPAESGADHDHMISFGHPIRPDSRQYPLRMIGAQDGVGEAEGDNEILA